MGSLQESQPAATVFMVSKVLGGFSATLAVMALCRAALCMPVVSILVVCMPVVCMLLECMLSMMSMQAGL